MSGPQKLLRQIIANYYLYQLRKNQWKGSLELKRIQFKRLKAVIKYAYDYVPYYHRLLRLEGIRPEDIQKHEDLRKIPLVSKQDILEHYQDFIANGVDISKLPSGFTSGSTGPTLKFYYDYSCTNFLDASNRYPFFECGTKLTDNFVTVWGRESQSIEFGKKYAILVGGIRNTTVPLFSPEKIIEVLRQINPDVIWTFPSVLTMLANYDISEIRPRLIFTQGEMVTQHCRDIVKKSFNSELFETYGSVEFGHLAFECNKHYGLHVITDGAYLEFIDRYGEYVSPGEQGEIIVTGLWNRAMPLIRYRIGDLGIPTDEKCACGRSWPLIKSIQGRTNDYLVLPSGKKIPAGWLYIERIIDKELKKNVFSISHYQIIQDRKNRVIIKFVKGKEFDLKIVKKIKSSLETYFFKLGEELEIVMQAVEEIPRGRTGKKRDFVSML
jgi:phenylacetate-CoA ligase